MAQLVLSRIPGTYAGNAVFTEWDRDVWTLQEQDEYAAFTLERWVQSA